jgi:Delta7-sterol 5-desaturase
METFLDWLRHAPWQQTVPVALAENVVLFAAAVGLGELATRLFSSRRVNEPAPPMTRGEVMLAVVAVLTNTLTTVVGMVLWRHDFLRFRDEVGLWAIVELLALLLAMDAAMYVLHRIAHHPLLYPWLHRPHHEYDRTRPLTLFLLNPLENIAFGALMLAVFAAYPFSYLAISLYLTINLASGVVGHLGVEPLPDWWGRVPLLRCLTGGTFHARHHQDDACNFGFYTLIWDRLFRTLRSDYWSRFGKMPAGEAAERPQHS